MAYNTTFLSIRMKLDNVMKDIKSEKQIIENIRYCRRIVGKEFKVIFWNKNISEKNVKEFIKRNNANYKDFILFNLIFCLFYCFIIS